MLELPTKELWKNCFTVCVIQITAKSSVKGMLSNGSLSMRMKLFVAVRKCPPKKLFRQNKDIFKELDTKELEYFPWESDEVSQIGPYKFTTGRGLEVKNWDGDICVRKLFPREKYRELLKLITHILNGVIRRESEVKKDAELKWLLLEWSVRQLYTTQGSGLKQFTT